MAAEVFRGRNEAAAEDHLPVAIDGDAGKERVIGRGEPLGETEAVFGGFVREAGEDGGGIARDDVGARGVEAAVEDVRFAVAGHFAHDHDFGDALAGVPKSVRAFCNAASCFW